MRITFLGATETVTGSRFLVETGESRILVDCGLFQGLKALRLRNRDPFPVDPASIDAVVLTHAHIDHSGYIPALVKNGFRGSVHSTPATFDLCRILLPDSGHLQVEEARYANVHGTSRHHPAVPLYDERAAHAALERFATAPFGERFSPAEGLEAWFTSAGHILGAACVHVSDGEREIVFTGDVGGPNDPVIHPPAPLEGADALVLESTYGNRRRESKDPIEALAAIIRRTIERSGIVLVPSFAVGRAQTLLHLLARLLEEGRIPKVPVYLNSPMAITATEMFCRYAGEHRLSEAQCDDFSRIAEYVRRPEDSEALSRKNDPSIIISASGMATGGRVLHHLKALLPEAKNTILFVGYQAAGTRGEALVNGADAVKIHGRYIPVGAEIASLDGFSAHADYVELTAWLRSLERPPRRVFLVHGEPSALDAFRRHLRDTLDWEPEIATFRQSVEID